MDLVSEINVYIIIMDSNDQLSRITMHLSGVVV